MIDRKIEGILKEMAAHFPVINLVDPRQSGKTTLVKNVFSNYLYVNLENTQNRRFAMEDPQGFIIHNWQKHLAASNTLSIAKANYEHLFWLHLYFLLYL